MRWARATASARALDRAIGLILSIKFLRFLPVFSRSKHFYINPSLTMSWHTLHATFCHSSQLGDAFPGKFTGRELSPKVKEIEPFGFQQNVRLEILSLAPQEQNLGEPRFWVQPKSMISSRKQSFSLIVTLQINGGCHDYYWAGSSVRSRR